MLIGLSGFVSEALSQNIIRGPYLQIGTDTSVVLRYRTDVAIPTDVVLGLDTISLPHSYEDTTAKTEHEILLGGLSPETRYFYAIRNAGSFLVPADSAHSFLTSPVQGSRKALRAWILGDCGTGNNNARAVRDAFYDLSGDAQTDMMILLGDNAYNNGTDAEYQQAMFQNMYESQLQQTVVWPSPGNHEFFNGLTSSDNETGPYYDIFSMPKAGQAGGLSSGSEAYYSFDHGNAHFISLDSYDTDRSLGGAMLTWLQNDLAATIQEWIIVFFHHPPYTRGSHNSDNAFDSGGRMHDMRENVLPILEAAGVDLVLSGHSHSYERSFLVNGHYGLSSTLQGNMIVDGGSGNENIDSTYSKTELAQNGQDGTIYIVAGSSGKISGGSLNHPVMYASINQLGSCVLDIDSNRLDLRFLNSVGTIADQFSIEKTFAIGSPPVVAVSAPADGSGYASIQAISLEADANDSDGNIDQVDFYVNGGLVGSGSAGNPSTLSWTPPANGVYEVTAHATDDSANTVISAPVTIYVGSIPQSQSIQLSGSANDTEEGEDGVIDVTSTDLELANENNAGDQLVGMRFASVNIPKGATITNAYLQFTVDETQNINPSELVIFGEDEENAAPLGINLGNLSSRERTDARVSWSIPTWGPVGAAGAAQQTPDISTIVQEIIDIPTWTSGNFMNLMIAGRGRRTAESADGSPVDAVVLHVDYVINPPLTNTAPSVKLVSPEDSLLLTSFAIMPFRAEVIDTTGIISQVDFYVGGALIASDTDYPFEQNLAVGAVATTEIYAVATDDGGLTGTSDTITVLMDASLSTVSLVASIQTGNDDAEEASNGNVDLNSSDLELVRDDGNNAGNQVVGLRFDNLKVPQGAVILDAYLQFQSAGNNNHHPNEMLIQAEAVDDAAPFLGVNGNVSGRSLGTASANWSPPIWTSVAANGPEQRSPNLRKLIEEVVQRPGWSFENALVLTISGTGRREAFAYDGDATRAPELHIVYSGKAVPVRGPYLQQGTDTSMVIRYRTSLPTDSKVSFGTSLNALNQSVVNASPKTEHELLITGLTPNTQYYYQIEDQDGVLKGGTADFYFITAPVPGTQQSIRAWILGDPGTANNDARTVRDAYYNHVAGQHTDLMIMLGDNAYNIGSDQEYQVSVFENMYEDLLQQTVLYPCPGNHEFLNGSTDSDNESGPYYDIFTLPRNAEAGGLASGTEAYYSYDYGNIHFISMDSHDSDRSPGSAMLTWLQNDLAATTQEWIVVYFHHPP
ncbi:MAG: metallophosphoesterase, partial [Bacteroidota bacterium]